MGTAGPEREVLTGWDVQSGDLFGSSFDRSDEWMLVGSPGDDLQGIDSGSVAAFALESGAWKQRDLLGALAGQPGDRFGSSLSISGDWCAVGAPGNSTHSSQSGAVYLFHWNGERWDQTQVLHGPDSQEGEQYGTSLSFDSTTLAVGTRFSDNKFRDSGAVHIYELFPGTDVDLPELVFSQTLHARTESAGAEFGFSLEMQGEQLIVGAWAAKRGTRKTGAAYLFSRTDGEWIDDQILWPSANQEDSCFGLSVSLAGNRCLVGAPWEQTGARHSGAAYVYRKNSGTWDLEAHLKPEAPLIEGTYGIAVALGFDNQEALIGSLHGSKLTPGAGAVSHFRLIASAWLEQQIWSAPQPRPGDDFGVAVSWQQGPMVVAARAGNAGHGFSNGGCLFLGPPTPEKSTE
jgi:hypothetical protein